MEADKQTVQPIDQPHLAEQTAPNDEFKIESYNLDKAKKYEENKTHRECNMRFILLHIQQKSPEYIPEWTNVNYTSLTLSKIMILRQQQRHRHLSKRRQYPSKQVALLSCIYSCASCMKMMDWLLA